MLLEKLLKNVKPLKIIAKKNPEISAISDDSRKVKKGGLFVAIKGLHVDSHKYIFEVYKKGAKAVVVEALPRQLIEDLTFIKVKDSRKSLGQIAANYYGNPSKDLKIIGVTGTKGKTTTVYMIYHILNSIGMKTGMVSSIEAIIGEKTYDTGFHVSNPEPLALQKFLSEMVGKKCEYAVLEVTSHGIDQKRIAGIKFDVTVLTNIAPEHLDYHKTLSDYKKVKMSFLKSGKYQVTAPKKTSINIFAGKFNNLNAEAAVKTVSYFGIRRSDSLAALKTFKLPPGRLEEITEGQNFRVFIDFAHTPDSLDAVLSYLRSQTDNKLIAVFGSAGERDKQKRPKMGAVAAKYSDIIVLTSEDPRSEDPEQIIKDLTDGITGSKFKQLDPEHHGVSNLLSNNKYLMTITDREEAIKFAILKLAEKGDIIAFLGKGHEKSMNLDGNHEIAWSEHNVVKKYLKILK